MESTANNENNKCNKSRTKGLCRRREVWDVLSALALRLK